MPDTDTDQMITIMTEDGPIRVPKSLYESMPQMFRILLPVYLEMQVEEEEFQKN